MRPGIAERARGIGAQVLVTEVDPVRALDALMPGFRVLPMARRRRREVFITATGSRDVIGTGHMAVMRDGAILANACHFMSRWTSAPSAASVAVHPAVRRTPTST